MIAVTPELKDYPRREIISSTIDTYICVNLDNNVSEFSRQLGVSKRTATELRRGTQLPQLRTLLNICALLDTTPRAMFINKVEGSKTEDTLQIPKLGIAVLDYEIQPPRVFDKDYVYDHLEGVLKDNSYPPPTMTKVANELNFDASFLHNHFPDLCSKISERYLQYRAEKKAHRIANLCGRVRRKILELHRRGELPIRHRLSQIFHKVIQTVPEISDTYCQTMHELGYPQSYWLVCVVTTS
jgi:transcriptional regulator with XRE-family HTH domain